jgi:hypothetical protein
MAAVLTAKGNPYIAAVATPEIKPNLSVIKGFRLS